MSFEAGGMGWVFVGRQGSDVSTPSPTKKVVAKSSMATPKRPLKLSKVSPKTKPVFSLFK